MLTPTEHPLVKLQVKTIATEIFARIVSGEYSFGTRIPPERELAEEFEASRATIRQALDFLESYGVVARRAGSGTFITYHKPSVETNSPEIEIPGYINIRSIVETASPFEMNVAVHILEPEMVRLATIYMSTRDLQKLSSIVKKMETIVHRSRGVRRARNGIPDGACRRAAQSADPRHVSHRARGSRDNQNGPQPRSRA